MMLLSTSLPTYILTAFSVLDNVALLVCCYLTYALSRSIHTARFIVWQPRRAADTSTNWQQSLLCCCSASMEQTADEDEAAAIDGLVSA